MEERNQFKKLRYDNEVTWKANITQRELSDKIGLAFSTIAKLEKDGCDNARVSSIKAYKKYFLEEKHEDICYEYFFGDVSTKNIKYHDLGKLFPFDDDFYKNLHELLALDENNSFVTFMLSTLLNNPQQLFFTLITIFNSLYKINSIKQNSSLSDIEKNEMIRLQEYTFNQTTTVFLENNVMPLLERAFEGYDKQCENESVVTQEILNEIFSVPEEGHANSTVIKTITPVENE